ncbi:MAG: hypothetical protein KGJ13_04870, partial [Patescibacteria group bacterium]|nr:hypothetical protein [Patescibacteria group bacterium]
RRGRRSAATASRPSYLTEENTRFDHPLPFDERKTEMNILLKKTHRFFLNSEIPQVGDGTIIPILKVCEDLHLSVLQPAES